MKKVSIRASQFITTYGVGAIIDSQRGPAVILNFENSGFFQFIKNNMPEELIISYPGISRLSKRLKYYEKKTKQLSTKFPEMIGIFEVPTNPKFQKPTEFAIYKLIRFPNWSLCNRHKSMQILYPRSLNEGKCPICFKKNPSMSPKADDEVIRFVQICSDGHLSDVDWKKVVHQKTKNFECEPKYLEWNNKGVDKDSVIIRCPDCNSKISLGELLRSHPKCPGTSPESGDNYFKKYKTENCSKKCLITQRSASNVFSPNIITSISIPLEANALYKILSVEPIKYQINRNSGFKSFQRFRDEIEIDVNSGNLDVKYLNLLQMIPKEEEKIALDIIHYFYDYIKSDHVLLSEIEFRLQEFRNFHEKQGSLSVEPTLIIDKQNTATISFRKLQLELTPIPQLEVIMVQEGYKRLSSFTGSKEPKNVYTPYITDYKGKSDINWYPGVVLNGEGIFIELSNPEIIVILSEKYNRWLTFNEILKKFKAIKDNKEDIKIGLKESKEILLQVFKTLEPNKIPTNNQVTADFIEAINSFYYRNLENFTHPIPIWWHTFAHRIIKAISKDCGYSLASIRERIYFDEDNNQGGILIYSSRPGEDGTMGGLVSLMPQMRKFIDNALKELEYCSNDPICIMNEFEFGEINGAACYSCLYLPETSCEFGNMGLDRNLLLESIR